MNGQNEQEDRLGIVELGSFVLFTEKKGVPDSMRIEHRLTRTPMQAGQSPESQQLDLTPHEGRVMLVRGQLGGAWIYSAEIIEVASPILTRVTLALLSSSPA